MYEKRQRMLVGPGENDRQRDNTFWWPTRDVRADAVPKYAELSAFHMHVKTNIMSLRELQAIRP